jgi:hypothetical protein
MSIHDCLLAVPHGSLPIETKTLQAASEGLPSYDSTAFIIHQECTPRRKRSNLQGMVLGGGRDDAAETVQCTELSDLHGKAE